MVKNRFISKKNSKCLDISLDLNFYDKFRLRVYDDSKIVNEVISGALYLYGSGCSVNIKEDVEWVNKRNPTLIPSLPFLDIYSKWKFGQLKEVSKDVNYLLSEVDESIERNDSNFINLSNEFIEMSSEEYGPRGQSLQKVKLLDLLFVPSAKIPRLFFYKFVKKHLKLKMNAVTNLDEPTIDNLIHLIEKAKGYYNNSDDVDLVNRTNLKNQKRSDRKRFAKWFRDGGNYDLF